MQNEKVKIKESRKWSRKACLPKARFLVLFLSFFFYFFFFFIWREEGIFHCWRISKLPRAARKGKVPAMSAFPTPAPRPPRPLPCFASPLLVSLSTVLGAQVSLPAALWGSVVASATWCRISVGASGSMVGCGFRGKLGCSGTFSSC